MEDEGQESDTGAEARTEKATRPLKMNQGKPGERGKGGELSFLQKTQKQKNEAAEFLVPLLHVEIVRAPFAAVRPLVRNWL